MLVTTMISGKSQSTISVSAGSDGRGTSFIQIILKGEYSDLPSVANRHRIFFRKGKARIVHDSEVKARLVDLMDGIKLAFLKRYGFVPAMPSDDHYFALIVLSSRNWRKDPENCSKGFVDYGLVGAGLLKSDKKLVVLTIPHSLLGASKDETKIYVCRLSYVLPKVRDIRAILEQCGELVRIQDSRTRPSGTNT